jgi:hypothetical protein
LRREKDMANKKDIFRKGAAKIREEQAVDLVHALNLSGKDLGDQGK